MRFYRLAHVAQDWESITAADNGHPLYVHRIGQGAGRFDLPEHYLGLYIARQAQAAIGEVFQDLASWPATEITRSRTVKGEIFVRSLVALDVEREFIDLDDPAALDQMGWRPSDVVNKDRSKTQELALDQWLKRAAHGKGGFQWWSSCRPAWTVAMAWSDPVDPAYPDITIVDVDPVYPTHPSVVAAAHSLRRTVTDSSD